MDNNHQTFNSILKININFDNYKAFQTYYEGKVFQLLLF